MEEGDQIEGDEAVGTPPEPVVEDAPASDDQSGDEGGHDATESQDED